MSTHNPPETPQEPERLPPDLEPGNPIYLALFAGAFLLSMLVVVLVEAIRPH